MDRTEQPEYFTKKQLTERGWTESLIKRFLGNHDAERPNPRFRSSATMKLFQQERVIALEHSDDYQSAKEKTEKRRTAARNVAAGKRQQLLERIEQTPIEMPNLSRQKLLKKACRHYNERMRERQRRTDFDFKDATADSDQDFLCRISVNFLRHELTPYEEHISSLYGRIGRQQAYLLLKCRILAAIAEKYPWLSQECDKQTSRAEEESAMFDD